MRRPRASPVVRWCGGALAVLAVLYLALANVLLGTGAGRALLSTRHVRVDYRSGYSLWPGSAHFKDVEVRALWHGRDDEAWRATVSRLDADVRVLPLFAGRLHAPRVLADRVRITTVAWEPRDEATPARPPALVSLRPREHAAEDEREREPLLAIDDLELTQIEQVSATKLAYVGTASARGAFTLSRRGDVDFRDARADVLSGEVRFDGRAAAQNLSGRIEVARLHVAHGRPAARSILESFEGAIELASTVPPGSPISPEGAGAARISARVVAGKLAPGSTAELHMPPLVVEAGGGRFELAGDVAAAVGEHETVLSGRLRDVRITPTISASTDRAEGGTIEIPSVTFDGTAPSIGLASPLADAHVSLVVPELGGDVSALPFVSRIVEPPHARIAGGHAELALERGMLSGALGLRTEPLTLTLGEGKLAGTLAVEIDLVSASMSTGHVRAKAKLRLEDGAANEPAFVVTLDDADLVRAEHGSPTSLDAKLHVEMRSADPFLRYVTRGTNLPGLLDMLVSSQPLSAGARLHAEGAGATLTELDAALGPVHAEGQVSAVGSERTSTLLLTVGPLAVGVEAKGPETSLILVGARAWFDEALRKSPAAVGTTSTTGADVSR